MSQNVKQTSSAVSRRRWLAGLAGIASLALFIVTASTGFSQESTQQTTVPNDPAAINQEIEARRLKIQDLQKQIEQYERGIKTKQEEAITLENELIVLQGQIAKTELEIESLTFAIQEKELEIDGLSKTIVERERQIGEEKETLASLLRTIQRLDRRTVLEVLVAHDSFAEFFDELRYLGQIESGVVDHVKALAVARDELAYERDQQEQRRQELLDIHSRLEQTQLAVGQEKDYQSQLLAESKESGSKFSDLLQQAAAEQKAADSEIAALQRQAETISQGGAEPDKPVLPKNVTFDWPVTPLKGISAYFHDPTYIFRKYFEHPAIDIPTPQGTPILAPADGYVARAKNAGFGYSYIMLIHNDTLATVYGHVSRIDVSEESFVRKGQVIGLTGGLPGTAGAGRLTTGPHLHFEVRVEGVPVNPLDYLP